MVRSELEAPKVRQELVDRQDLKVSRDSLDLQGHVETLVLLDK